MRNQHSTKLEAELGELFDIKNRRIKRERQLNEEVEAAQKDIKLLILMFSEGIPNITIPLGEDENLEWDPRSNKLLYHQQDQSQFIEGISKETLIKIRPHLNLLVRKAKEFYQD